MDAEENNSRHGNLNSPPGEEEILVELNLDLMNTIQSLQVDLLSFRDDNTNERREQKEINESLLQILTGVNSHR